MVQVGDKVRVTRIYEGTVTEVSPTGSSYKLHSYPYEFIADAAHTSVEVLQHAGDPVGTLRMVARPYSASVLRKGEDGRWTLLGSSHGEGSEHTFGAGVRVEGWATSQVIFTPETECPGC